MEICTIKYTHPQSPWGKGVKNRSIGFSVCWVKDMIRERRVDRLKFRIKQWHVLSRKATQRRKGRTCYLIFNRVLLIDNRRAFLVHMWNWKKINYIYLLCLHTSIKYFKYINLVIGWCCTSFGQFSAFQSENWASNTLCSIQRILYHVIEKHTTRRHVVYYM